MTMEPLTAILLASAGAAVDTAEHASHAAVDEVGLGTSLFFTGLLVALILCLAFEERLHAKKSVIVGLFATVCLFLGGAMDLLPFGPVQVGGHAMPIPVYIPAIDWGVIAIILGYQQRSMKSGWAPPCSSQGCW